MKNKISEKTNPFDKNTKWIGFPGITLNSWRKPVQPAPYFRRVFKLDGDPANAKVHVCGLGYYELYLNGEKVGDHVLDPVMTQYDIRVNYVEYDVSEYLVKGENVIGVILGNGWYNCHSAEVWHFEKASWRDYPKLLLQLESSGKKVLTSDVSWKLTTGPIVFDGLRNGETYDARLELDGWLENNYDDSNWKNAGIVSPPGGLLQPQTMPPCKVMQTLHTVDKWTLDDGTLMFDIGQNIAGWGRITVGGEAGAEIIIEYGERLNGQRGLDQSWIGKLLLDGEFQTDHYILKGNGKEEVWEPRFTYHGFQYVNIKIKGNAEIKKFEGRLVHTSFDKIGKFSCSDDTINKLQECTVWSYIGNFTGIPTDCPHREKNGWTGDAQLAAETGLFNFAGASSYIQWLDTVADCQRPSGQLPGIAPSTGWGYNWGSGPAWDSALILIPWYIYLYTGDLTPIKKHYEAMKKYVDYCTSMATDNIVSFGLGDWCHVDRDRIADPALTSTGYYYIDTCLLAKFAKLTGRNEDYKSYSELAENIKLTFNAKFYRGDGIYANGEMTALGCAIYQGLVADSEKHKVVEKLAEAVEANDCKADFGILGAKYVPRALADNGFAELAFRLITQPEFPGWINWLRQGATTLWEQWGGDNSRNHIMFGDVSAWMYQYLTGITPDPENPGFKHFFIKPNPVDGLSWASAEYLSPYGKISSKWEKDGEKISIELEIPEKTSATLIFPDEKSKKLNPGKHCLQLGVVSSQR